MIAREGEERPVREDFDMVGAALDIQFRLMQTVPHDPTEALGSVMLRVGIDPDRHPEYLEPTSWADVRALDLAVETALAHYESDQ
jgi:hypothetical protein